MEIAWTSLLLASLLLSMFAGCQDAPTSVSQTRVIGGIEDYRAYPATVRLHIFRFAASSVWSGVCTGNIVRDDLVLTAAHCFRSRDRAGTPQTSFVSIFDAPDGPLTKRHLSSAKIIVFPADIDFTKTPPLGVDAAFVVFPKRTFTGLAVASIASSMPKVDDLVHLVGYGLTDASDLASNPEFKRFTGSNHIKFVYQPMASAIVLESTFVGMTDSTPGEGDSGGGLYNDQGEIVGLTFGGGIISNGNLTHGVNADISALTPEVDFYTNLGDPSIHSFVTAVMASNDPTSSTVAGIKSTPIIDSQL